MIVKPGEENAADDAVTGRYETYYKLRQGDVVVDIGAHVGYFTMLAAEKVGPSGIVHAFEPNPDNFGRLEDNCAGIPNIRIHNSAVWDSNGELPLFPHATNTGGHSLFEFDGHLEPVIVTTVNLGWWLSNMGIRPHFIKIDAECSELTILQSFAAADCYPYMALEIHTEELYRQCRELLLKKGYIVLPESPTCRRCLMFANCIDDIGAA